MANDRVQLIQFVSVELEARKTLGLNFSEFVYCKMVAFRMAHPQSGGVDRETKVQRAHDMGISRPALDAIIEKCLKAEVISQEEGGFAVTDKFCTAVWGDTVTGLQSPEKNGVPMHFDPLRMSAKTSKRKRKVSLHPKGKDSLQIPSPNGKETLQSWISHIIEEKKEDLEQPDMDQIISDFTLIIERWKNEDLTPVVETEKKVMRPAAEAFINILISGYTAVDVMSAITNYKRALDSDEHFYTYRHRLDGFLSKAWGEFHKLKLEDDDFEPKRKLG